MHALRQEILPPSGVEHAACLKFTTSTLPQAGSSSQTGRTLFNIVVARSSLLRIFEVREEPAPVSTQQDDETERRASVRKEAEAVEGEVEMDGTGDGFVNVGTVKVNTLRGNEFLSSHRTAIPSSFSNPDATRELASANENPLLTRVCVVFSLLVRMARLPRPLSTASTLFVNIDFMAPLLGWTPCVPCTRWRTNWTDSWFHSRTQRCVAFLSSKAPCSFFHVADCTPRVVGRHP